jgi:hypothetical protein
VIPAAARVGVEDADCQRVSEAKSCVAGLKPSVAPRCQRRGSTSGDEGTLSEVPKGVGQGAALAVGVVPKGATPDTLAYRVGGLAETVCFEAILGEKTVCLGPFLAARRSWPPRESQFSWLKPRARCPKD